MRATALALLACTLALGAAAGTLPLVPWYSCDPATCLPANNCQCASQQAPLPADQMPQFILYTHDDGIVPDIVAAVNATVGNRKNPNGCSIPLTWFTIRYDTEPYCSLVKQLWKQGHEIALHTRDHIRLDPPIDSDKKDQMTSVKAWLNATCGIPLEDMVGMRDPFLINSPGTRQVQHEMGLLYDSTINEHWTKDGLWPTSANGSSRLWPYSMDHGIPQVCDATGPDGSCTQDERYPGLWEVPLWVLQTSNYPMDAYAMDPGGDVFQLLKINFDAAYKGNRAPIPIYMHKPWMVEDSNQKYVQEFMDYVLQNDDVWFVTMHQLIDWMRNPIPKSEMKEKFNVGCQAGGSNAVSTKSLTPAPAPAPPASTPSPSPPASTPSPRPSPRPNPSGTPAVPAPSPAPASGAAAAASSLAGAALLSLALALLL